jgi:hypothetical protein
MSNTSKEKGINKSFGAASRLPTTIRGSGDPLVDMASKPSARMDPLPRSFAADAH